MQDAFDNSQRRSDPVTDSTAHGFPLPLNADSRLGCQERPSVYGILRVSTAFTKSNY